MFINLIAAVQSSVPPTTTWSPSVALVMILCNIFAFVVGRFAIKKPGAGPALPLSSDSGLMKNFGVPELLATASLGHIIGAGVILGLSNAGAL